MAINYNDPYNQGIGTLDLGNMNLGQVPVNNMQVAEAINYGVLPGATELFEGSYPFGYSKSSNYGGNTYTGTTKEDFYNALEAGTFGMKTEDIYNKNINDLFKGVADDEIGTGMFFDAKPTWERTGTGTDYKGTINVPKKDLGKIPVPKGFWKDDDQASLDDDADFYNEYGYPKTAGIGVLTGLKKMFGSKLGAYLFKAGKHKAGKEIGKKVKPVITGVLTGGAAQGAGGYTAPQHHGDVSQGGGYQAPNIRSAPKGVTTSSGMHGGKHYARGGRASYFDGGLLSLWPR